MSVAITLDDKYVLESGRVYLTDGSAYFNRPGPRIVDGLEILAQILHPELDGSRVLQRQDVDLALAGIEGQKVLARQAGKAPEVGAVGEISTS